MPKQFFTEHDIEDMVKSGVMTLEMTDDVVLTDLAYEKATRLGLHLVRPGSVTPPSAPVRPYVSQKAAESTPAMPSYSAPTPTPEGDLAGRIRQAVIAKMGSSIDPALLDAIITRVLRSTGVK